MSGLRTYLFLLIALLLILSSCRANAVMNSFNFNTLNKHGRYLAAEYGSYDPEVAREYCKEFIDMPVDAIWSLDPDNPFPSPIPSAADCGEINSQLAYGCDIKENNLGSILKHSVVEIFIPKENSVEEGFCSGTVIGDGKWILTAAHCFTNTDGSFQPGLNNQPVLIRGLQDRQKKFTVDAVYIPVDFRYYQSRIPIAQHPYFGYENGDIALLRLKKRLPDYYQPIDLAEVDSTQSLHPVVAAGYGLNEKDTIDGLLHFRREYYITKKYNENWRGGDSGNYGEIYVSGTIPIKYNGMSSSWRLTGRGDSGGPILKYDERERKFNILGVHSSALFCNYPAFFAKIPYSYSTEISVPYYYPLLNSVINGTSSETSTRCISATSGCFSNIYISNAISQNILIYRSSMLNNKLTAPAVVVKDAGSSVKLVFHPNNKFAYAVSPRDNSITIYKKDISDNLVYLTKISSELNVPADIAFDKDDEYAYVVNEGNNSISRYHVLSEGYLVFDTQYDRYLNHPISILTNNVAGSDFMYVLNSGDGLISGGGSISVYKVDLSTKALIFQGNYTTGIGPTEMVQNPSGEYLYVPCSGENTIWVYKIGRTPNNLQFLKTIPSTPGIAPYKIVFTASGFAYVINKGTQSVGIYKLGKNKLDKATGDLEYISSTVTGRDPSAIAVSRNDKSIYITDAKDNSIWRYSIENDGRLAFVASLPTGSGPSDIIVK